MTNKINGIDVSEYEQIFAQKKCALLDQKYCEDNPDCYYKQLKRLQEENKELKTYIQKMDKPEIKTIDSEIALKNIELQQENEQLKKDYHNYKENCKCCDEYIHNHCNYIKHKNKYKQALEEIRKEITPVCAYCNNIDGFTTWDDCENVCEKGVIKYLKIIDEVLNDRD